MKHSIRTRFTLGMIFLFLIILILAIFSGYYMNELSNKTSAILKENYLSVVYAREMSEGIMNINQEITTAYLIRKNSDSLKIGKELSVIDISLSAEKNNITEPGEDKLVAGISIGFAEYRKEVLNFLRNTQSDAGVLFLQNKSGELYNQLIALSQMNGKALEVKTDDAKAFSQSALTRMTVLATLCFLVGMSFTFSFAAYFNRRFFQLYYGIKELVSSNFSERLFFDGKDEFSEISSVINEMADKLKINKQKISVNLPDDQLNKLTAADVDELKKMLFKIKTIEEQSASLISKFEKK